MGYVSRDFDSKQFKLNRRSCSESSSKHELQDNRSPQFSSNAVMQMVRIRNRESGEEIDYDDDAAIPKGWTIVKGFGDRFERLPLDVGKKILLTLMEDPSPAATQGLKNFRLSSKAGNQFLLRTIKKSQAKDLPPSLARTERVEAGGRPDIFQPKDLASLGALYGLDDHEKATFLKLAVEGEEQGLSMGSMDYGEEKSLEEKEKIFESMKKSDRNKAIEEAVTMKALKRQNPKVHNVRRPFNPKKPEGEDADAKSAFNRTHLLNVAGKYDYLIDLPEQKNVPLDPKSVRPYVERHWGNPKLSREQRNREKADKQRGVDPKTPFNVAYDIAKTKGIEKPENYSRWIASISHAQLHELTEEHQSASGKFKGIVVSNIGYITPEQRKDLTLFREHEKILAYYGLHKADLERIIEVSPTTEE